MAEYPKIKSTSFGRITVGEKNYDRDIYILTDGSIQKRQVSLAEQVYGTGHKIGPEELKEVCQGKPEVVFIGTGQYGAARLCQEGEQFLSESDIVFEALPTPKIIDAYNKCRQRKAALIHLTC